MLASRILELAILATEARSTDLLQQMKERERQLKQPSPYLREQFDRNLNEMTELKVLYKQAVAAEPLLGPL